MQTNCSAEVCDRLKSFTNPTTPCACFAQYTRNGQTAKNVCINLGFRFKANEEWICIDHFTSLRTSRLLFEKETISHDCQTLLGNQITTKISESWKNVVKHVNNHGGWTIMGWFVRAIKTEEDKQENDEDAIHESIKTNITYLYPTTLQHGDIPKDLLVTKAFIRSVLSQGLRNHSTSSRDVSRDNV